MRARSVFYFLFVFFAGALTSSNFEWLQPTTAIEVRNASNKVIRYVDIEYQGIGDHKGRIAENLTHGQAVIFKWATEGEGSYRLHVIFEDGSEVHGGAGYIERGSLFRETVESARVMSQLPVRLTFGLLYHSGWDSTYPRSKVVAE